MEENKEAPDHILPIFFTTKTQEIFSCIADVDVTEENPYKIFTKEQIRQDFRDRAAISDFHPAKKIVEVPYIFLFFDDMYILRFLLPLSKYLIL